MTIHEDTIPLPADFSGTVRLFPLPNMVMFPHIVQPLHIFEPRYCQLMEHALEGDQLITMALLKPGWEPGYEGAPPIYPQVCIGRIVTHSRLAEGTYNLALLGVKRATILRELPPDAGFRQAEVNTQEDIYPVGGENLRSQLRAELIDSFRRLLKNLDVDQQPLSALLDGRLPLGTLVDIIAFSIDLDLQLKVRMLQELNVEERGGLLLSALRNLGDTAPEQTREQRPFPPPFSAN